MSMPIMPSAAPRVPMQAPAVPTAGPMPNQPSLTPSAEPMTPPMGPQTANPAPMPEGDSVKFSACSKTLEAQPAFQGKNKETKKPLLVRLARLAALLG